MVWLRTRDRVGIFAYPAPEAMVIDFQIVLSRFAAQWSRCLAEIYFTESHR